MATSKALAQHFTGDTDENDGKYIPAVGTLVRRRKSKAFSVTSHGGPQG
jgi:hypothetical protein